MPAGSIYPVDWLGTWQWKGQTVIYARCLTPAQDQGSALPVLMVHGFGACKEHWRHNLPALAGRRAAFAIDLIGFGASDKPRSRLDDEPDDGLSIRYGIDLWADQVVAFIKEVIGCPVQLIGNSIGGVVALAAAVRLEHDVRQVILIDCAQRSLDDQRLSEQPPLGRVGRPLLKRLVRQRWLTGRLFRWLAKPGLIRRVLAHAYPTGGGLDEELVQLLLLPTQSPGAEESFRGFINLFQDRLAPDLLSNMTTPVRMLWGGADPWEPVAEACRWARTFPAVRELRVLPGLGHCPHDEQPSLVNLLLDEWLLMGDSS